MKKILLLVALVPFAAIALSGKIDASVNPVPYDYFSDGNGSKILENCSGDFLSVCNSLGEEAAIGWSSGQTPETDANPETSEDAIRAYLPSGFCRVFAIGFDRTDVFVQVRGSASATSGTITADCR